MLFEPGRWPRSWIRARSWTGSFPYRTPREASPARSRCRSSRGMPLPTAGWVRRTTVWDRMSRRSWNTTARSRFTRLIPTPTSAGVIAGSHSVTTIRPLPTTTRQSGWGRTTPGPMPVEASFWKRWGKTHRRKPITIVPSSSTPALPTPSGCARPCSPGAARTTGRLRISKRQPGSVPTTPKDSRTGAGSWFGSASTSERSTL